MALCNLDPKLRKLSVSARDATALAEAGEKQSVASIACCSLHKADDQKCGKLKKDLEDKHASEKEGCSTTPQEAEHVLVNCKDHSKRKQSKEQVITGRLAFATQGSKFERTQQQRM